MSASRDPASAPNPSAPTPSSPSPSTSGPELEPTVVAAPYRAIHDPGPIDLAKMGDVAEILRGGERRQSLRGFEEGYRDIVDYIVRITHRIWEQAEMGYIYDTYAQNCVVHTGYGSSYGVEEVVSGSVALLAGFPDRRLTPLDVIWAGDDEHGFHSSHLILNTATNTGYSPWGPPTGKQTRFLGIANCFVRENRVVEEWLVRDTGALVRQLGYDLFAVARRLAAAAPPAAPVSGETDRLHGQNPPAPYEPRYPGDAGAAEQVEDQLRRFFHEVVNRRRFNVVDESYASDAITWVPNHAQLHGPHHARSYLLGLIAMFPDAHLNVEHICGIGNEADGWRVAVRWRLSGSHRTYGWYGPPTGNRADILGISQLHLRGGKITAHYLLFDELAVLAQLLRPASATASADAQA